MRVYIYMSACVPPSGGASEQHTATVQTSIINRPGKTQHGIFIQLDNEIDLNT